MWGDSGWGESVWGDSVFFNGAANHEPILVPPYDRQLSMVH